MSLQSAVRGWVSHARKDVSVGQLVFVQEALVWVVYSSWGDFGSAGAASSSSAGVWQVDAILLSLVQNVDISWALDLLLSVWGDQGHGEGAVTHGWGGLQSGGFSTGSKVVVLVLEVPQHRDGSCTFHREFRHERIRVSFHNGITGSHICLWWEGVDAALMDRSTAKLTASCRRLGKHHNISSSRFGREPTMGGMFVWQIEILSGRGESFGLIRSRLRYALARYAMAWRALASARGAACGFHTHLNLGWS